VKNYRQCEHQFIISLNTGLSKYMFGDIHGTHFCYRLSRPQCHSAARRIMSMKNANDTVGNRTRDLPACSTVPQSTAPGRATLKHPGFMILFHFRSFGAYDVDCRVVITWKQTLYLCHLHKKENYLCIEITYKMFLATYTVYFTEMH
jgi:hypothetical protein